MINWSGENAHKFFFFNALFKFKDENSRGCVLQVYSLKSKIHFFILKTIQYIVVNEMLSPFTWEMGDGLNLSVYDRVIHESFISLSTQEFLWPSQSLKRCELSQVLTAYQFPFALLIFNWGNIIYFCFVLAGSMVTI